MDTLRDRLISKIDEVLSGAINSPDTHPSSEIHIEARVVSPNNTSANSVILETIKVDDLRLVSSSRRPVPNLTDSSSNVLLSPQASDNGHNDSRTIPEAGSTEVLERVGLAANNRTNSEPNSRRKEVGGLRPTCSTNNNDLTPPRTPSPPHVRQIQSDGRAFPKRRKVDNSQPPKLEQSTVDKLIEGIWEQIHSLKSLSMGEDLENVMRLVAEKLSGNSTEHRLTTLDFNHATRCCQQITTGSRTFRAFEVIIQAYFVDCFDGRIAALAEERPDLRPSEHKKMVLTEACKIFSWSEKELRNRMGIWKGYREIKNAAGWSALIFAGPGIYRFCKYRMGFGPEDISKFQALKSRAEVAADTLQPQWRQLLKLVGEPTQLHWRGHPHDWAVGISKRKDPVPIALTYRQWDPNFIFTQLDESLIDQDKWTIDPRRAENGPMFFCKSCSKRQSHLPEENECECFPDLYSPNPRTPRPLQVFQTENGRNNGLIACCTFDRGSAVGEFIGLITKGLADVDVMQSQAGDNEPYQIWQGRYGNYTRFINHSCQPNCQFQTFSWLGIQRIVVVSKGVPAGKEVTVDYSGRYWQHLDKVCLCGEPACRYKNRAPRPTN